jgi:hypothetical protein
MDATIYRQLVLALSITLLMLGMVIGCTRSPNGKPPASALSPPLYPGAQQVQVREFGQGSPAMQVTSKTSDSSEKILTFYKDVLLKDGWTQSDSSTPTPMGLRFYWSGGCPGYSLQVTVKPENDKPTIIELEHVTIGCE